MSQNIDNKENGKYDIRNRLNDLTGKEWLKLTKSYWESESCKDDKAAYSHPAPFLIKDIEKLIKLFTKSGMVVLDPFVGSGTTIIAATNLGRKAIGIDLSKEYKQLAEDRFEQKNISDIDYTYILGDSNKEIEKLDNVDYIVTSPPYHNILQNKTMGIRKEDKKGYRTGSRIGIEYYSDKTEDLGNQDSYEEFLNLLKGIFQKCYNKLNEKKYMSIIISDFTVNKKEICVQADIVDIMEEVGFEFCGTTILLQNSKPLYPFGYPYSYKINHHHQNIINFKKS